jgi:hypothetical protein
MSVEEAKGVLREDLDDLRDVMERLFANSPEKLAKARLHLDGKRRAAGAAATT